MAYNYRYILGMLLVMHIRFVSLQYVQSGEHVATTGVFLDWILELILNPSIQLLKN